MKHPDVDEHVGCGKIDSARLKLYWYKPLHQTLIQSFSYFLFREWICILLCLEISFIYKQTHWRWMCLLEHCLGLSSLWVFQTCSSSLVSPSLVDAHRYTEQQIRSSVPVISITLSDCEENVVYLNIGKEWRVWSRL